MVSHNAKSDRLTRLETIMEGLVMLSQSHAETLTSLLALSSSQSEQIRQLQTAEEQDNDLPERIARLETRVDSSITYRQILGAVGFLLAPILASMALSLLALL